MSFPSRNPKFIFRRLTNEDLPLMHDWLNRPHVAQHWDGDVGFFVVKATHVYDEARVQELVGRIRELETVD